MKQQTVLLTIGLGCILFAASSCMGLPDPLHTASCSYGMAIGNVGGPATQLLGCAIGETVQFTFETIGAIENRHNSVLEPTTAEPTVVRWDVTYAPLPTTGDTPTQPAPAAISIPSPTPHN